MTDTTQIVGVISILFALIIQYISAYRGFKKVEKQIKEWTNSEDVDSAIRLMPLMMYCKAEMFIISMVLILLVGMVIF